MLVSLPMMSDIRVSMREFRFLEEKRKLAPLTQAEEQRWVELGRTLGIFELAEANPNDIAEVDPNDVVLVEPGPNDSEAAQTSGPAENREPERLAQKVESAQPSSAAEDSIPLQSDKSPAQDTTASLVPPPLDGAASQSEAAPKAMSEGGEHASDAAAQAVPDTAGVDGDTWNGGEPAQGEPPPVIDLSLLDATPGRGVAVLEPPSEMPSSDAPGAVEAGGASPADGAPPQPAAEPANDMPEPWGGQAAAQAFPTTSPQFRNPIRTPSSVLEGERRVVVHLLDGQVKRGTVRDLDVAAATVPLESAGDVQNIPADRLTAIFFMRAPGSGKPEAVGQKIRLTFQDGRQVIGFSSDYQTGDPGFFLIPADLKTNTERIFVYRWSVYSIAEE